jgi:hypothetical protein
MGAEMLEGIASVSGATAALAVNRKLQMNRGTANRNLGQSTDFLLRAKVGFGVK